jgi:hypothetical protein
MQEQGSGNIRSNRTCSKTVKIKMSELIVNAIGSTESIKSYLMNSNCVAFISIHAIEKN